MLNTCSAHTVGPNIVVRIPFGDLIRKKMFHGLSYLAKKKFKQLRQYGYLIVVGHSVQGFDEIGRSLQ